jgi:hypothetical protein
LTATELPQYIEARGDTYRVRFPKSIHESRWYGTFTTLTEALEARNAKLHEHYGYATLSPVKEFRSPLPSDSAVDFASIDIPLSAARQFQKPITIPDANALVFSDLHIPHHSPLMLQRAIYIVKRYFPHINRLIVAGDSWDFTCISKHPKNQPVEDLEDVLERGAHIYRAIGKHFSDIYVTNGNHDERIGLKLDSPFTLKRVFNSAFGDAWPDAKMHITNMDYVLMDSLDGDASKSWIIGHPSHYGQSGKVPASIAELEGRNCASGHNHQIGVQQSASGRFLGVDLGHMTNPESHYYVQRRMTKFTRWSSGFLIVSQGRPYPYWERFSDWASLGCK